MKMINKPPHTPASYYPISLLLIRSKIFDKGILHRLIPVIEQYNILRNHQFGFRSFHCAIHEPHRLGNFISVTFKGIQYGLGVFFDISQAF